MLCITTGLSLALGLAVAQAVRSLQVMTRYCWTYVSLLACPNGERVARAMTRRAAYLRPWCELFKCQSRTYVYDTTWRKGYDLPSSVHNSSGSLTARFGNTVSVTPSITAGRL